MHNKPCRRTGSHARFDVESLENRRLLSGELESVKLDVGATPESVIFADFNADEALDTAVLAPGVGEIQIWSPDGTGGVAEWGVIEGDFENAQRLQVLDVDADGLPDIGFFESDTHRFTAYRNNGDGTFQLAGGLQLAETATGFIFLYHGEGPVGEPVGPWIGPRFGDEEGEFEHDGGGEDGVDDDMDAPEANFPGDPYMVIWHESLGAAELVDSLMLLDDDAGADGEDVILPWPFDGGYIDLPGGVYFDIGSGGDAVAMGDFNRDGERDLAFANRTDGTVSVAYYTDELEAAMEAGYDPSVDGLVETETIEVGAEPVHINIFDANVDGRMDLLVSNAGDGTMSIAYGAEGGFGEVGSVEVEADLTQAFINFHSFGGDLFVLGFSANGTVTELQFTGTGLEVHKKQVGALLANDEVLPRQIVVGEFTGDGCIDVAVIDQAGEGVAIYKNVACDHDGGEHDGDDDYGGPPFDSSDIPVPGVPDLLPDFDSGESDSDNITAINNAGGRVLKFRVNISHVAEDLLALKMKADDFFEAEGRQFDEDGFEYLPKVWVNLYSGDIFIGTAEVDPASESVVVATDGFTVLREGLHKIRAGFVLGAPGLRGLLGTRSGALEVEIRIPKVEVEPPAEDGDRVTIRKDEEGNAILVLEPGSGDGESEEINLGSFADLPPIVGSVVTVRETRANAMASRYAAGQSEEGLVLFVRTAAGDWSGRNLTDEIEGAEPITASNIEVLTTPWGNVNMAGLNEDGELVFYWQDGRTDDGGEFRWNYVNLADSQLRAHGQDVPEYASSLESFVTPWGAMNVAGIDENGHLVVVWWSPGVSHWVTSDLTELLGSTPLVGDVSAWVTPWGGINLVGLNEGGEMVAVWWAPGREWTVSPLGDLLEAPTLVHGSLASFISDRGDTFVAGLTTDGAVGVFSWTLDDFSWDFVEVEGFEAGTELVGSVSGYYTGADQSLTLLVSSLDGEVFQLVGDPFSLDDPWSLGLYDSTGSDV